MKLAGPVDGARSPRSWVDRPSIRFSLQIGGEEPSATVGSEFQQANEQLARRALELRVDEEVRVPFICECADDRCLEPVTLTLADYAQHRARAQPVVIAEHVVRAPSV